MQQKQSSIGTVISGVINTLLITTVSICAATFIFSGKLAVFLPTGIGIALVSSLIIGGLLSLKGSFPSTISAAAIIPAALIGVMAQSIYSQIEQSSTMQHTVNTAFPTVLVAIMIVTTLTGVMFYMFGKKKWGTLVRFIPYPVMGGFLAGVGWVLIKGSINVMRRVPLHIDQAFAYLLNTTTLIHIIPGVVFAVVLLMFYKKYKHYSILPTMIVGAIGLFYLFMFLTGNTYTNVVNQGWLIEPFTNDQVWESYNFSTFSNVDWGVILTHFNDILVIMCVSIIALLLTATGIESSVDKEIDLDHDLKYSGMGNILIGLLGGIVGYHYLLMTKENHESGANNRIPGLLSVLLLGLLAVFGASSVVSLLPKPILGGVLLFFGLQLLVDWVITAWKRSTKVEYAITLVILAVIISSGFLEGIVIGVALSTVLFVVQYSQIGVVKHIMNGASKHSNVERSMAQQKAITTSGNKISIITLQGYLFFGTAHNLYTLISNWLNDPNKNIPEYVIFDFHLVKDMDSSAGHSFVKIKRLLQHHDSKLIFTNLSEKDNDLLKTVGCLDDKDLMAQVFEDVDFGIEWCEDQILKKEAKDALYVHSISHILNEWFNSEEVAQGFIPYLEMVKSSTGSHIFQQGDLSDRIYILENGQASIYLEMPDGSRKRLKKIKEGAIVGEMGVIRQKVRSASLIADKDSTFYCLSIENFNKMKQEQPNLAVSFQEFVSNLLSDRLAHSNTLISEL